MTDQEIHVALDKFTELTLEEKRHFDSIGKEYEYPDHEHERTYKICEAMLIAYRQLENKYEELNRIMDVNVIILD